MRTFRVRGVRGARGVDTAIPVVVKRYDRAIPGVDGVRLAFGEARGLTAAEQSGLPAPRLVAIDADGARTGAPAVAMTRLRGEIRVRPTGPLPEWLDGLADTLVRIAGAPQPAVPLPEVVSWRKPVDRDSPPAWIEDAAVWRAAVDRFAAGLIGDPPAFIHRDYHPLNVLWDGDAVSGVVDWVNACTGPIQFDLSRCRVNIALVEGVEAADQFLVACGGTAHGYDRAWDLETVFSLLGNVDVLMTGNDFGAARTPATIREALAAVVTAAVR